MKKNKTLLFFLLSFIFSVITPFFNVTVKATLYETGSFYPQSDSDDAMRRLVTDWYGTIQSLTCGVYSSSYYQYGSGMVFRDIGIPNNATIISANITITCRTRYTGTPMNTMIRGQYIGNSSTFTTKADFDNRRTNQNTTANVYWDNVPVWSVGVSYTTPDISTVVQEIVSHVNWTSENSMCLFWDDWDDRTPHGNYRLRSGESYDTDSSKCPKLEVTWVIPSVHVTFYNNAGGIFRIDSETTTNGTLTEYANNTVLELSSLPQNNSFVFSFFEWDSTNTTSNPHNLTVSSNQTVWCIFAAAPTYTSAILIVTGFIIIPIALILGVSFKWK